MKTKVLCALLLLVPAAAPASEQPSLAMRVYGSTDEAAGLFLMPWQSAENTDVDRAPRLLNEQPRQIDAQQFQRYVEWYQAHQAYRRWRLQRNNW